MLGGPRPGPVNTRMRDAGKDAGRDKVQAIMELGNLESQAWCREGNGTQRISSCSP